MKASVLPHASCFLLQFELMMGKTPPEAAGDALCLIKARVQWRRPAEDWQTDSMWICRYLAKLNYCTANTEIQSYECLDSVHPPTPCYLVTSAQFSAISSSSFIP